MNARASFAAWSRGFMVAVALLVSACGGGGSESSLPPPGQPPDTPPTISTAEAVRFLRQASFGPTAAEVEHLQSIGYLAETWARSSGHAPRINVDGARMAQKLMYFSSAKAEQALGYSARPVEAAFADAIAWFTQQGYLG